ncbi:MAG: PAS domain S-box protein [Spirochaetia bacterium]|nr:PAS domain S-box protein [Spirochaetia bacterium]
MHTPSQPDINFFNTLQDMVFILDENGSILFVNDAVTQVLGYSYERCLNMTIPEFHPPEFRENVQTNMECILAGTLKYCDIPLVSVKGVLIPSRITITRGTWEGEAVLFCIIYDITELSDAIEKFRLAFDKNPSPMAITDLKSHVFIHVNDAFVQLLGYRRDQLIGRTSSELQLFANSAKEEAFKALNQYGRFSKIHGDVRSARGELLHGLFSGEIITVKKEKKLLTVMEDVTKATKLTKDLQIKTRDLEYKDRLLESVFKVTQQFLGERDPLAVLPFSCETIGKTLDVSRVYVFITDNPSKENGLDLYFSQIAEWCAEQVVPYNNDPLLQHICGSKLGDFVPTLLEGKLYEVVVDQMPHSLARQILEEQGIVSMIILPVFANGTLYGFVGFDECRHVRIWTEVERRMLNLFIDSVSVAVLRQQIEQKLLSEMATNDAILQVLPDMVFVFSPEGTICNYFSSQKEQLIMPPEQFIGQHITKILPPEISHTVFFHIKQAARTGQIQVFEYEITIQDKSLFYEARMVRMDEKRILSVSREITERRDLELQLRQEKTLLRTTLLSVGDAVVSTDNQGLIIFMNPVAESLTGWSLSEAVGRPFSSVVRLVDVRSGGLPKSESLVEQVLKQKKLIEHDHNTFLLTKEGAQISVENSVAPIAAEDDNICGLVMVFRDTTEKRRRQQRIKYLSYHDRLTRILNRRSFEIILPRIDISTNLPLALIMADVNGLKLANDAFGHQQGDALLQRIALILITCKRKKDYLFRIGGDEFLMVLPCTNEETVLQRIGLIDAMIEQKQPNDGSPILSLSMGYAIKDSPQVLISDVFKHAEDEMYRNKLSESRSMRSRTIDIIMNSLYEKSPREQLHSKRVSILCELISKRMCLQKHVIDQMRIAGLMHDIGKIGIDNQILDKPGPLSLHERSEIERHAEKGFRILSSSNEFSEIALYVLEHHERLDGSGYPKKIAGDEISMQARILAVADTFDAMTSDRPYRKALPVEEAFEELRRWRGIRFDSTVVDVLIAIKNESEDYAVPF